MQERTALIKRAKFVKLAERRTDVALKRIALLGNLGDRAVYEFNEEDVQKILGALEEAIEGVKTKLNGLGKKSQPSFKL